MYKINKIKKSVVLASGVVLFSSSSLSHAFSFKAGETDVSIYGYAKLDVIYDLDSELGNSVGLSKVRLDEVAGADGHTTMHAYESRFGFSTATRVSGSQLKTKVEGDFYGSGGSLRLRHAYGEWNGILAGQTWLNFYGFVSGTPTIDFTGVGGKPRGHRQAQLRYTTGNFSVSLEDPDDKGVLPDALGAKSALPDISLRYTDRSGPVKYSLSGVGRYLEYDNSGLVSPASDDSAFGWGVGAELSMDVTDSLTVRSGIAHGEGIGGYMSSNPGGTGYVDSNGNLELITATGFTVGASLEAGPGSFNTAYSSSEADLDDNPGYLGDGSVMSPGKDDKYESIWLNYIWSPADKIDYGLEVSWHSRETAGGFNGDAVRLQGMAKYSF